MSESDRFQDLYYYQLLKTGFSKSSALMATAYMQAIIFFAGEAWNTTDASQAEIEAVIKEEFIPRFEEMHPGDYYRTLLDRALTSDYVFRQDPQPPLPTPQPNL